MSTFHEVLLLLRDLRQARLTKVFSAKPVEVERSPEQELERAAYEQGRHDGEQALREQLLRQRNDFIKLERGVLESLRQILPKVARDCERALTELCMEVAQKLVAGMPISAELVERVVQEAIAQIQETTEYNVYLNPEDLDLLQQYQSQLLADTARSQPCHFHPDPDISRGGCEVKTRFGVVDAQQQTKFELLKKALLR